jgi:hypothetical protein
MVMPADQSPQSPEPSVEIIYPTAQEKKSPLSEFAPEIRDLLRNDPEATRQVLFTVLDGMKAEQAIRREIQQQEFGLKKQDIEQRHVIDRMRETRLTDEAKARKNTTRILIGAITFAFAGSLGYAVIHKDSGLANTVFTGAMGIIGGAGGLALSQKKDPDSEK